MDWKNTPRGVKEKVKKADKKAKSGGDPHGRTKKEKVKDFVKGVGLTSKQKKAHDFIEGGLLKVTGIADLSKIPKKVSRIVKKTVGGIIKKAHAKPKSDLKTSGSRKGYPHE
jgi:hypothetical protein